MPVGPVGDPGQLVLQHAMEDSELECAHVKVVSHVKEATYRVSRASQETVQVRGTKHYKQNIHRTFHNLKFICPYIQNPQSGVSGAHGGHVLTLVVLEDSQGIGGA